jgi:hypothetical protein
MTASVSGASASTTGGVCFHFENGDAFDVEIVDYH